MCTCFVGYIGPWVLPTGSRFHDYLMNLPHTNTEGLKVSTSGRQQIKHYTGTQASMLNGLFSKNWWAPWDDFALYNVILNVAVRLQTLRQTSQHQKWPRRSTCIIESDPVCEDHLHSTDEEAEVQRKWQWPAHVTSDGADNASRSHISFLFFY